ncbi:sensor domain-containing diguanylate cyclase [Paenibacillus sp. S-38]|uniref:sensor domain-containing diguanylate cyclase n=1 Tax=Paenibacillus sp. S-38 TaxID=3416710 RepID=UPI003CE7F8A7
MKNQLRLGGLLTIVLVALCYSSITVFTEGQRLAQQGQKSLESNLTIKSQYIERWLDGRLNDLRFLSRMPEFQSAGKETAAELLLMCQDTEQEFDKIHFIGLNGELIASTYQGIQDWASVKDRVYFQEAMLGHEYVSDLTISKTTREPVVFIAVPVRDEKSAISGVLVGSVKLEVIDRMLAKLEIPSPGTDTYLVDLEGRMLSDFRHSQELQRLGRAKEETRLTIDTEIYQDALKGQPAEGAYRDYRGQEVYGSYVWVNGGRWLLISELEKSMLLRGMLSDLMNQALMGFIIILVAALFFVKLVEHRFADTLRMLVERAQAIRGGFYAMPPRDPEFQKAPGEYRILMEAMNEMSETVRLKMDLLKASEQKFKSLFDHHLHAVCTFDLQGNYTSANTICLRESGYSLEEFTSLRYDQLLHPSCWGRLEIALRRLKNGGGDEFEVTMITKDGQLRRLFSAVIPIYTGDDVTGAFCVAKDMTEQLQSQEKLRASEEKYRFLTESSSDMISVHDKGGAYKMVTPACGPLFGYEPEELIGRSAYDLIHPEDSQHVILTHKKVWESAEVESVAYRIRRKDSSYLWVESKSRKVHSESEGETVVVVTRDISERKQTELALTEVNKKLQHQAEQDGLTQIPNRRLFDKTLRSEWRRAARTDSPLSMILIDIDYFKAYNDTFGHLSGDECLKRVAAILRDNLLRETDLAARFGGEEFAILLPHTDLDGALVVAEHLRNAVEAACLPHPRSRIGEYVTISLGVASLIPPLPYEPTELIEQADRALYHAKRQRNHVEAYNSAE